MDFLKFNSLENTYKEAILSRIMNANIGAGDEWLVTEKVDGANFAFYYDGKEHKVASRNQFVDGTFYASSEVIAAMQPKVVKLANFLGAAQVILYGELYGPSVQGRINYGSKGFVGFDIVLKYETGELFALDKVLALCAMRAVEIPTAPVIGYYPTLSDALKVSSSFRSYLTPEDHEGDNFAEGVVIEPCTPATLPGGSRVYLKNRSPEFSEISNAKYKAPAESVATPEEVNAVLEAIFPYVTENRVHNVRSKIGEVTGKDFGKLMTLTVEDALEDFQKDTQRDVQAELGANYGLFRKLLTKAATDVVRPVFICVKV